MHTIVQIAEAGYYAWLTFKKSPEDKNELINWLLRKGYAEPKPKVVKRVKLPKGLKGKKLVLGKNKANTEEYMAKHQLEYMEEERDSLLIWCPDSNAWWYRGWEPREWVSKLKNKGKS